MNEWMKTAVEDIPKASPRMWRLCYPRRIIPPTGYANPKYFAIQIWARLRMLQEPEMNQLPHVTTEMSSMLLVKNHVPTYFVAPEFSMAVAKTRPPEGFKLQEIVWPVPALLFVLHEQFSREHFGWHIPFIAVSRAPVGTYPRAIGWPFTPEGWLENLDIDPRRAITLENTVDRILIHGSVVLPKDPMVDYVGNYPLKYGMDVVKDSTFTDSTGYERLLFALQTGEFITTDSNGAPTKEDDVQINQKLSDFAIKLMLALTARPGMVKTGTVARPQKIKKGRIVQAELWNPSIIGESYRVNRSSAPQGGTHASPRFHWRIGHYSHQAFGKRENAVRITELPRKDNGEINWAQVEETDRQAFWGCHRLVWIEPILVNAPTQ